MSDQRTGTHDHADDPRNAAVLVYVNGELRPRAKAVVSVFDSGFVLGDGVWEGLRVHHGHPAFLDHHLDRLFEGAAALALDIGRTRSELTAAIYDTLRANDMHDGVHIRLMVTRGIKATPYQDPRVTVGPATVVIIAEHKEPLPEIVAAGITLVHRSCTTARTRHPRPEAQLAQQAQRHHGLHPGLHRRSRRGTDARPAGVRGHLQLDALLHRPPRRAVDVDRRLLSRRHHPAQRAHGRPRGRDPSRERTSALPTSTAPTRRS